MGTFFRPQPALLQAEGTRMETPPAPGRFQPRHDGCVAPSPWSHAIPPDLPVDWPENARGMGSVLLRLLHRPFDFLCPECV